MRRNTILIVDDEAVNRSILRAQFEQEYDFMEAENGEQAMMLIRQYRHSMAVVLLDLVMPVKDGYEVLVEIAQAGLLSSVPVIVITAENSMENEVRAFDLGASDIILKPFEPHVVRRRVQNVVELNRHKLHLEEMVEEQASKLRESRDVIMDTLSSVIEHRSAETGQHVLRIRMFTKILLEDVMRCYPEYELDRRTVGIIAEAASLHDIGKIAIPDNILNKPGRLTDEEFEIMKTHTVKGCEILAGLERMDDREYLAHACNICRYHHERWDGGGYPDGLAGDSIPICAQVVGVADCYDALTTDRVYRRGLSAEKAATMILNGECGAFSPQLLECFKNVGGQFAALALSYADGRPLPAARLAAAPAGGMERKLHLEPGPGHSKYFTLLRYLDRTVVEVDLDLGAYHLVYQQNQDFQVLRSGEVFADAFRKFADTCVHPEDRCAALDILKDCIDDFFGRGLMKRSVTYRVLHRATGAYVRYEATAMRVSLDNPKHRKLLLVWNMLHTRAGALAAPERVAGVPTIQSLPVGVQQCLADQWFTVTYVNEGFTALFGYDQRELKARFHNHYLEMIHPEDQQGVRKRFLEQIGVSGEQELEYRVVTRQGRTVWILDRCRVLTEEDGREYLNCVLMDITQVKRAQEALRLSMEQYQIIFNQTNDIVFEWDIRQDRITYSPNWNKLLGYAPLTSGEQVRTASHILPEDIPHFSRLMGDAASGVPYGEAEIRIANAQGRYLWCRIRATAQFDNAGRPVKAVGVIVNIDAEKRQTQALATKAERDALTRLFNKAAAHEKIQRMLEERQESDRFALFLLDMDNFKQINDTRGHMFGDSVLTEAAARISALFRAGDILSRFGGDEFLIFLKHTADDAFLRQKAAKILETLHSVYADELRDCPLSSSIGIARCPEDGGDFQTLFQKCDRALYQAKQSGKVGVALYEEATMKKVFSLGARQLAAGTHIESDDTVALKIDSLVPQAYRLLYETRDMETAINAILEMTGRKYNVSRVYIFEDSEDGLTARNTFEWCGEGVRPSGHWMKQLSYADLGGDYRENFNENGVFYCTDPARLPKEQAALLAGQGVRSLLQCAVRDKGRFVGFVGFDDCTLRRTWTQDQIDALGFLSELIVTFLLKERAQRRTARAAQDLRMILDNQSSCLYVIDPDTFVLSYINGRTLRIAPEARIGMRCHAVFFRRDTPCENCPARGIRTAVNQTLEVYNPVLQRWIIADAALIHWGDRDACLLACRDISKYKAGQRPEQAGESPGAAGPRAGGT